MTHALPGTWRVGAQVIEITGPHGGPLVPAEDTSLEGRLAVRIARVVARHAAEAKALGAGDAVPSGTVVTWQHPSGRERSSWLTIFSAVPRVSHVLGAG